MDKDNYTKYKYIGLYILNKNPEFIIDNVKKIILADSIKNDYHNLHNFINIT